MLFFVAVGLGFINLAIALDRANTTDWNTLVFVNIFLAVWMFITAGVELGEKFPRAH